MPATCRFDGNTLTADTPASAVRPRICLNMIVKNEAHIIRRCLDSVRPFVDRWAIVDTGSTDGTQALIREIFRDVPGELHERPWRDFAHNRTEALRLAAPGADYLLFIDADEVLRAPDGFAWPTLAGDAYYLNAEYGGTLYRRCALVSTRVEWRWEGVLHEYLVSTPAVPLAHLDWPHIVVSHDGARACDPDTYAKDIAILEHALAAEPNNTRYMFYLAQSYRDAGQPEQAQATYLGRAAMGGFEEEAWYALYQAAVLNETLRRDAAAIVHGYLAAYQRRPQRAEPLYQLARFHRERNELAIGYMFAKQAAAIPRPADLLFIDDAVYSWRSRDEYGVAAYWVGTREEGLAVTEELLAAGTVPAHELARVQANLGFFLAKPVVAPPPNPRAGYSVYVVTLPGYLHSRTFAEIALGLQEAFAELGLVVPIVDDPARIVGRAVVLGANLLPATPQLALPDDAIVFNLEQASRASRWISDAYIALLRRHEVWDYSAFNVAALRERGVARIRLCGVGYAPCLTRIAPVADEDIDVLFYGEVNPRRTAILDAIAATGLRVHRLFGIYGAERDRWIARAKIVLNLHAYPEQVLAIVRVSYLLANRRFVISEHARGADTVETALRDGMVFGAADEIPALCRQYAADRAAREAIARRGFEAFKATRQADLLAAALIPAVGG